MTEGLSLMDPCGCILSFYSRILKSRIELEGGGEGG